MNSLFESEPIKLNLKDADIVYFPHFFDTKEANSIFELLINEIPWQQDTIRVFGKSYPQPRLTALFGNQDKSYSYSNIKMFTNNWTPLLEKIKIELEKISETHFNVVLLNYYRNGKDSNGWHADNEKELGTNPVIASLSFGAKRCFQLKHNFDKSLKKNITLEHGSLLIMQGTTQHFWKHQIPKTSKPTDARINLTFRFVV